MGKYVTLLLGSNLGSRERLLTEARRQISERVGPIGKTSGIYASEPWGEFEPGEVQPFLNQALQVETELSPEEILKVTQEIEQKLGRNRTPVKNKHYQSRTMDIDMLLFGNEVIDSEALQIPHPRMAERRFVLEPLAEIMPETLHPVLKISLKELFNSILLDDSQ